MDECNLSNTEHHARLANKTKLKAILFKERRHTCNLPNSSNKTEHLSYKGECVNTSNAFKRRLDFSFAVKILA